MKKESIFTEKRCTSNQEFPLSVEKDLHDLFWTICMSKDVCSYWYASRNVPVFLWKIVAFPKRTMISTKKISAIKVPGGNLKSYFIQTFIISNILLRQRNETLEMIKTPVRYAYTSCFLQGWDFHQRYIEHNE